MNPITNMKNLNKMNDREIEMGVAGTGKSWHNEVCNYLKLQHFKRFLHTSNLKKVIKSQLTSV